MTEGDGESIDDVVEDRHQSLERKLSYQTAAHSQLNQLPDDCHQSSDNTNSCPTTPTSVYRSRAMTMPSNNSRTEWSGGSADAIDKEELKEIARYVDEKKVDGFVTLINKIFEKQRRYCEEKCRQRISDMQRELLGPIGEPNAIDLTFVGKNSMIDLKKMRRVIDEVKETYKNQLDQLKMSQMALQSENENLKNQLNSRRAVSADGPASGGDEELRKLQLENMTLRGSRDALACKLDDLNRNADDIDFLEKQLQAERVKTINLSASNDDLLRQLAKYQMREKHELADDSPLKVVQLQSDVSRLEQEMLRLQAEKRELEKCLDAERKKTQSEIKRLRDERYPDTKRQVERILSLGQTKFKPLNNGHLIERISPQTEVQLPSPIETPSSGG